MILFIYGEEIEKLTTLSSLMEWFNFQFIKIGLDQIEISKQKNPFEESEYISIYEEGKWAMSIRLEKGIETITSNLYYVKYLPVDKELKTILSNSKSRIRVNLNSTDRLHPEDTIDALTVLEKLPNSKMFDPLGYHRKKIKSFPRQITKNKVSNKIEPIMENILTKKEFLKKDKLLFQKSNNQILEVVFYSPIALEDNLCTKASFCLYASNENVHKEIQTKDGFITWYVEPDGSNLEEIINDFENSLSQVNNDWFKLKY